jgi:hypothetical protein
MSGYSPAPGTPQTGTKAIVSGVIGFILAFGAYYVADADPFTKKEIVEAFLLAIVGSGLAGGGAYVTKNSPK